MKRSILLAFIALVAQLGAHAEITDSGPNGFTYKATLTIQASPAAAYQRFVDVANWWASDHTFSGDAKNLSLEARPMGCWCEKLPNGGGVRHMEVLAVMPGKTLVLSGGLGPLQALAATGTMKITFAPADGGTKVDVIYSVVGYLPAGMHAWAGPVDSVLSTQLARFKKYAETGDAAKK